MIHLHLLRRRHHEPEPEVYGPHRPLSLFQKLLFVALMFGYGLLLGLMAFVLLCRLGVIKL